MEITYYGHSCFAISFNGTTLLLDPFISPNELASHIDIGAIKPHYILLSHAHWDHIADCVTVAKQSNATVIANWEIHEWLQNQGVSTHPMNTGGKWDFGSFKVKCVVAQHSSSLPQGAYGGNPMGFIIYTPDKTIYYSGDTALTLDMQLIPRWAKLDMAFLPIGDNFTMDIEDAVEAASMVQCKHIVAMHYDTFGYIKIDHAKAINRFKEQGITLELLEIGHSMTL